MNHKHNHAANAELNREQTTAINMNKNGSHKWKTCLDDSNHVVQ